MLTLRMTGVLGVTPLAGERSSVALVFAFVMENVFAGEVLVLKLGSPE
jgi:hypothetical protein